MEALIAHPMASPASTSAGQHIAPTVIIAPNSASLLTALTKLYNTKTEARCPPASSCITKILYWQAMLFIYIYLRFFYRSGHIFKVPAGEVLCKVRITHLLTFQICTQLVIHTQNGYCFEAIVLGIKIG